MNTKRILLIVTLFYVFLPIEVLADGNMLLDRCLQAQKLLNDQPANSLHVGYCMGIVEGVQRTLSYSKQLGDRLILPCFPEEDIKNKQALRITIKYLKDHPENLHMNQVILLMKAFRDAFPCD